MTPQQIFDKVVTHLRSLPGQALDANNNCMYRTPDNPPRKCAAGILIDDEEYSDRMENRCIGEVIETFKLHHLAPHTELISQLQAVHDTYFEEMEYHFPRIAKEHNLTVPPFPPFPPSSS